MSIVVDNFTRFMSIIVDKYAMKVLSALNKNVRNLLNVGCWLNKNA